MKKIIYILVMTLMRTGCSDAILNKEPLSEISPETLFQTESGFRSALDEFMDFMQNDLLGYNFCIYLHTGSH